MRYATPQRIGLAVVVAALSLFSGRLATAASQEKKIEPRYYAVALHVGGQVALFRDGETEAAAVVRGTTVCENDRVVTGADSKAVLITYKRRLITLAANGELRVRDDSTGRRFARLGLGMFESGKGRSDIGAQAVTRASPPAYMRFPGGGMIRGDAIELELEPLGQDERYRVEVVCVEQSFYWETRTTDAKLALTEERIKNKIQLGVPYYIYISKPPTLGSGLSRGNEGQAPRVEEYRVGLLGSEEAEAVSTIEKQLLALIEKEKTNLAYPTLLAETYEANQLFLDAIGQYERIYKTLAPGDPYSRARLRQLYAETKNSRALRALEGSSK